MSTDILKFVISGRAKGEPSCGAGSKRAGLITGTYDASSGPSWVRSTQSFRHVRVHLCGLDTLLGIALSDHLPLTFPVNRRCHRIGQTRDVHIYRLVCAHTIEENIWRKQLQKRLLDEIVVDQGSFTTANATKKLGRLEVGDHKGSDLKETEWFSNANTLKELLTVRPMGASPYWN